MNKIAKIIKCLAVTALVISSNVSLAVQIRPVKIFACPASVTCKLDTHKKMVCEIAGADKDRENIDWEIIGELPYYEGVYKFWWAKSGDLTVSTGNVVRCSYHTDMGKYGWPSVVVGGSYGKKQLFADSTPDIISGKWRYYEQQKVFCMDGYYMHPMECPLLSSK